MGRSLVNVSKAFDHATFSTLKKIQYSYTQLSPTESQNNVKYIHNAIKITISIFLQEHDFIIYFTAKVVPLVQHIKMCTGSLKGGKATITSYNTTRSSEVFKYAIEIEAVKNNILRIHLYNYIHIHIG